MFVGKRSDDSSFSPEEINDMLQDKAEAVHVEKIELHDLSVRQPYVDKQTFRSQNWNFNGDIIVKKDYIRLISDKKHLASNMFAKMPIQADSFEMELTFHIHSKSTSSLAADGMVVWILDKPSPIGDVFGAQNRFTGLGVFLDTYKNGKSGVFPYVSAMLGNGRTPYNKYRDGMDTKLAGCTAKSILNPSSGMTRMRLIYMKNGYLSVDFNYNPQNADDWLNCFTLTDIHLPPVKYLGLSGETGELTESIDIIENKVFALYLPDTKNFIESVEQLEDLMEKQGDEQASKDVTPSRPRERTRKSVARLRNAEKRLKARERALRLEKYGDADATFPRRMWRRMITFFKYVIGALLFVFILWVGRVVYKTLTQQKRFKMTGLLD